MWIWITIYCIGFIISVGIVRTKADKDLTYGKVEFDDAVVNSMLAGMLGFIWPAMLVLAIVGFAGKLITKYTWDKIESIYKAKVK